MSRWLVSRMVLFASALAAMGACCLTPANAESSPREIAIAVVGPMTGRNAPFGQQLKLGVELGVRELNAERGVLGRRIRLVVEDDSCDPKRGVAVAHKLVSQGVRFVVGHFCSGASILASAVYAEHGVLQLTPYSPNPVLTDDAYKKGWKHVFRLHTRDDAYAVAAGRLSRFG